MAPLACANDPRVIAPLLRMLNDGTDDQALWALVHVAERFDGERYVRHLLPVLPDVVARSRGWASILMMRMLNDDKCRSALLRQVPGAAVEVCTAAVSVCQAITDRHEGFRDRTAAVLRAASADRLS